MLIPIENLISNPMHGQPKTRDYEIFQNIYRQVSKFPWFKQLYMDQKKNGGRFEIVVETRGPMNMDIIPSSYDGYKVRYIWDGKKDLSIEEALNKYATKHSKDPWFISAKIEHGQIWVKMKYLQHNLPDFYEDHEIRFSL